MNAATRVAMKTMITAPGQNAGPWHGADNVAEKDKHRADEQSDLGRAAQRNANAQVEAVRTRGGKCHRHFGRTAD
jgi:hypothetical protein